MAEYVSPLPKRHFTVRMKSRYKGRGEPLLYPLNDCDIMKEKNISQTMEKEIIKPCKGSCCPTIIIHGENESEITITDDYGDEAKMTATQWQELVDAWNRRQERLAK